VDYGVSIFVTDYSAAPAEVAREVEARGFESMFVPEHTHIPVARTSPYPAGGDLPTQYWHSLDPFVALAAAATATTRLKVGTGVCLVVERDPITLAKEVATLDFISGGRFLFGIGAGWNREEMANHGTNPVSRWDLMAERVAAMRAIWSADEPEFHGRFVDFDPIWQWPKPVQRPHPPILFGGQGPGVLERVLDHGTGWLVSGRHFDEHRVAEWFERLQDLAAERGRPPVPVSFQDGPANRDAIETCLATGLERYILRVPAADEATVEAALADHRSLVAPYGD
jgi:probable F420-dependent oxidoreductase